jgi:dihydroorotase
MNVLIRQAKIIAPGSPYHGKTNDILIESGKITSIKKSISTKGSVKTIEEEGLCVSIGFMDLQAVSGDPGFEHRETLESLAQAARKGGFTAICLHNHNYPALHSKSQIAHLRATAADLDVDVLPFGTVTVDGKGKDLAEMYDMHLAGAVGFSDYKTAPADSGMVVRALQYASHFNVFLCLHANEEGLSKGGQMNEGETSTALGMKGIPALAEELALQKNISILEYAGGKMHVPVISTKGSVDLIKKAKATGLPISCGVPAVNLVYDDTALKEFDTNFKLHPPLRTKRDINALRNAIENGTIDVVVSDHSPLDLECKELEFDQAEVGMISLQSTFNLLVEALGDKSDALIVRLLAENPRKLLALELPKIAEGEKANLTFFTLKGESILDKTHNASLSENSPLFGKPLKGKVIGTFYKGKLVLNS